MKITYKSLAGKLVSVLKFHGIAFLGIAILAWSFMGQSLTRCSDTVVGSIGGDHLSGIIWVLQNTDKPYGGISRVTNYPYGEGASQPQLITSAIPMTGAWLLNKAVGPVCAWNLMVFVGYTSSALVMYGFVFWLFKRRGASMLGAVSVAFTPYHYFKTHGHLSYIFSAFFIAILWSFLFFMKNPSKKRALLLGAMVGLSFYGDGYFPLLTGVLLFGIACYVISQIVLTKKKSQRKRLIRSLRTLFASAFAFILMVLPIVYVQFHYKAQITSSIASARGDIEKDAQLYGARPSDYFIPSDTGPIPEVQEFAQKYRMEHPHSNIGEYNLYLGLTVVALAGYAIVYSLMSGRRLKSIKDTSIRKVIIVATLVALVAGLTSLSPHGHIFGHPITFPSGYVVSITSFWRVFARLYLIANIGVSLIAVCGYIIALSKISRVRLRRIVGAVLILLVTIDLLPINPFSRVDEWSMKDDSHPTYAWLRDQSDIPAVAAYPILESPRGTTYFGDQIVHRKPLLNSRKNDIPQLTLHRALAGLGDQQTLGGLKGIGFNYLLLYATKLPIEQSRIEQLYGDYGARIVKISPDIKALDYIMLPAAGFAQPAVDGVTQIACNQALGQLSLITTMQLNDHAAERKKLTLEFDVRGEPGTALVFHDTTSMLTSLLLEGIDRPTHVSIDVVPKQMISMYHLSAASSYASICNLGIME